MQGITPRGPYKNRQHPLYRVMSHVSIDAGGCWTFTGALTRGYGSVPNKTMSYYAHRIAYECIVGHVGDGLDLDHLCRNRACCNPDHLEPVTRSENLKRGFDAEAHPHVARLRAQTECKRGHSLENAPTYDGHRKCKVCESMRKAERLAALNN